MASVEDHARECANAFEEYQQTLMEAWQKLQERLSIAHDNFRHGEAAPVKARQMADRDY